MATWTADDGTTIYYEIHGNTRQRDTLLLLPGLLGSINSQWRAFVPALSAGFRVVLADLRGHGRSENNDPYLLPERMSADLAGLLDHLEVASVHVAGYDLGGYLGLMLHHQRSLGVTTLLMHATKFYWTQESAVKMRRSLDPDRIGAKAPAYAGQLALDHGGTRWRSLVRQAADLIAYLHDNQLPESSLARTHCPVLVSVGDRDELITLQESQRLSRAFPKGALLVVPGAHHPFKSVGRIPLLPTMQLFHKKQGWT